MKNTTLVFSLLFTILFASCKEDALSKVNDKEVVAAVLRDQQASKFPVLEFDTTDYNFGEIINGTPVETVFNYKNTGDAPLVITDIKSTCGCTIPKNWSRTPLAPGAEGNFTVKFNGKGSNKISKTITVIANTEKGKELVKVSAFVKPDPNAQAKASPMSPVIR